MLLARNHLLRAIEFSGHSSLVTGHFHCRIRLMPYKDVAPPNGEKITRTDRLNVPDNPIIPFIRGDGTGPDIWAASVRVFAAAVKKAFGGKKKIAWSPVFAAHKLLDVFRRPAAEEAQRIPAGTSHVAGRAWAPRGPPQEAHGRHGLPFDPARRPGTVRDVRLDPRHATVPHRGKVAVVANVI